ncbi:transposase domain-containing protein [Streptomyces ipomoeae]|uniref:transposase domain-containing protein n=1 Tax=Streptomyces ipomoeae TaxID=103232 RepID=UPI003CC82D37
MVKRFPPWSRGSGSSRTRRGLWQSRGSTKIFQLAKVPYQRRLRVLSSRVAIYFLRALGMSPALGYAKVWSKLVAGPAGLPVPSPSEKALRDVRHRLGIAPVKRLFQVPAGPLAQPATPGTHYHSLRTVAFDGCVCSRHRMPSATGADWEGASTGQGGPVTPP